MKPISEENLSDAIIWQAYSKLGASMHRVSEPSVETICWEEDAYWCIEVEFKSFKNSESLFLTLSWLTLGEILSNFSVNWASESSKSSSTLTKLSRALEHSLVT